jgi:hypothetical protein
MPPFMSSAQDDVVEWPWRLPDTGVAAALEPGVRLLLLRVVHLGCDLARDGPCAPNRHLAGTVWMDAFVGSRTRISVPQKSRYQVLVVDSSHGMVCLAGSKSRLKISNILFGSQTWLDAMVTSRIQPMEGRGLRHDRLVQAASLCWPQPREDPLLGQHSHLAAPFFD